MDEYYKVKDAVNGYSVLKIIGEGRYGIAYLAVNDKNEKCVIKQLKSEMLERKREKIYHEKKNLEALSDPHFPRFISDFHDGNKEGFILEFVEGKVFEDILREDGHEFERDEIYKTAGQILEMVEILHTNNIVHRDIRLPNVILKKDGELSLIDFGLSRTIDKNHLKDIDFWFIGDFLIHLYYSSYKGKNTKEERPWFEELDLTSDEKIFLKRLMGIEDKYQSIDEIKSQLEKIRNTVLA